MKDEMTNEVKQDIPSFSWEKKEPAPEAEIQAFWKKLRHFYRTGVLPTELEKKSVSAALFDLLGSEDDTAYPFILSEKNGTSHTIEWNSSTPFHFLDFAVSKHHQSNRKSFTSRLSELITGLNQLLQIEDTQSEQESLKNTYDFADELIAFDKMVNLLPRGPKTDLSEKRLHRLNEVIQTLQKGLSLYKEKESLVILEKSLKSGLSKETLFENSQIIDSTNDIFEEALSIFSKELDSFVALIKAFRIASLEISDEFKEEVHEEFFEHFTWYRLSKEELNLFHPVILICTKTYLFDHLASFSRLLASNRPIKILVLNQDLITAPEKELAWEDASRQYKQEIATLAISHRNVSIFQSGMDDPEYILEGIENCLKSTSPSICHLSIPKTEKLDGKKAMLIMKAENAGRYFPKINYDPSASSSSGNRFQLSKNIQHSESWPTFSLQAKDNNCSETRLKVAFTYADYKAIFSEKAQELLLIPSEFYTEHLIPLSDYLQLEEADLYGKIPYIWLKDEQDHLHRAAIPNVWVVSCQERLDFWNQLQDLGRLYGSSEKVAQSVDNLPSEENTSKGPEIDRQQLLKELQEEAMAVAAQKLISVLLDDEEFQLQGDALSLAEEQDIPEKKPDFKQNETEKVEETASKPSMEAWVESENCTSCNECVDKYPNLFKYNKEKQAFIPDPSKGTFEELVKAAEKCPAACIHPGMPLNPKEPNLDKLIKRAEKFN